MSQEIYAAVTKAIGRQKNVSPSDIRPDTTLEQLGVSSLDAIAIVYEIEELFDIEVPNEKLDALKTVQDILDGITALTEAKG
ncbi:MAG: histidine kinase [Gammaproteobacteria bacterium]|nr:histidine kinase [Gammaproteobacteria bacterium]